MDPAKGKQGVTTRREIDHRARRCPSEHRGWRVQVGAVHGLRIPTLLRVLSNMICVLNMACRLAPRLNEDKPRSLRTWRPHFFHVDETHEVYVHPLRNKKSKGRPRLLETEEAAVLPKSCWALAARLHGRAIDRCWTRKMQQCAAIERDVGEGQRLLEVHMDDVHRYADLHKREVTSLTEKLSETVTFTENGSCTVEAVGTQIRKMKENIDGIRHKFGSETQVLATSIALLAA